MKTKTKHRNFKRLLAVALCMIITLGLIPINAIGALGDNDIVTAVAAPQQRTYSVANGTALDDVGLPKELTVTVNSGSTNGSGQATTRQENLAVTWTGDYDANKAADYVLTAKLSDSTTLEDGVSMPAITVKVQPTAEEAKAAEAAAEDGEEITTFALPNPIQVPDATNYIKLDSNNTVLKEAKDFGIGKKGELEFAVSFLITPNDIPEEQRTDVVAVFTIPAGFSVQNKPNISDVIFTEKTNEDGSTTVTGKMASTITTAVVGQFTIRQNAQMLLNNLAATHGTYNFDVQLYAGYGTDQQVAVTTPSSGTNYTSRLTLKGDTTTPTWNISNVAEEFTFKPGELFGDGQRQGLGGSGGPADASSGALRKMYNEGKIDGKGFAITIHKSKGYLTDGTTIDMAIPKLGEIFENSDVWFTRFVTDSGQTIDEGNGNNGYMMSLAWGDDKGSIKLDAGIRSNWTSGNDYAVPRGASDLSYADTYYEAGTFTIIYYPKVYYNRLYDGDWSKTTYAADSGCSVTYTNFATGAKEKEEGKPLKFKFIQGTKSIDVDRNLDLNIGEFRNLTEMKQYSSKSGEYNDSGILKAISPFANMSSEFQIQDNLKISYDFTEALTPVELQNLGTAKNAGLTYRIYVTDAVTGNVVRIETLLDEETSSQPYTPQAFGGVTETVISGAPVKEWKLAEADTAGNKLFVSRIEVYRAQYEYNQRGDTAGAGHNLNYGLNADSQAWFNYRLRAYHNRMSDGTDIPNNYKATIHRETTSDQIRAQGGAITKDYTVQTKHLSDNIEIFSDGNSSMFFGNSRVMEINDHNETGNYGNYAVRKYSDTMDYNVDSDGNTIAFGDAGYDPVVVELSGDAITMTDRVDRTHQRLMGVWDDKGVYHDLVAEGIDAESYLVHGKSTYGENIETTTMSSSHDPSGSYDGQLYKLNEIYKALGIPYATKLVVALDDINSWNVVNDKTGVMLSTFINKVEPGYLNYDNMIGTNGSADLPKQLNFDGALFCQYSDYTSEKVDGNGAKDSNSGTVHGSAKKIKYGAATFIAGNYTPGISIPDQDYYVNPFSTSRDAEKGVNIGGNMIANAVVQDEDKSYFELSRVTVKKPIGVQVQYKDATLDFKGTDSKLLSLTNTISFDHIMWRTAWKFSLDYTLSNGEHKTIDDTLAAGWTHGGRAYYTIPGVDIKNGVYIKSLKVKFPNDWNWGTNGGKAGYLWCYEDYLPSIGLGMYNVNIPATYPGTDIAIGSVSDNENKDDYDKLTVKAALSFKNLYGETLANGTGDYAAESTSARIKTQSVEVSTIKAELGYGATSTNQARNLSVGSAVKWATTGNTFKLMINNDIRVRPTYYYKVDKNFTYVAGSVSCENRDTGKTLDNISAKFISAGTGAGRSGSNDYGILKITYDAADYDALKGAYPYNERWDIVRFNLQAAFNAPPKTVTPITGLWMDTSFDANRDKKGGNESDTIVETTNANNQLMDTAPLGDVFGNTNSAKDTNGDGKAEMLYTDITTTHKINEQAVQGVVPYAIATSPYQESAEAVTSRDLVGTENLFSEKVYMSGDTTTETKDWEVFVPIMKKGQTQKYNYGGNTLLTKVNDFSVDFKDIDTSSLDDTTLQYHVYYTTDANPAEKGYDGAKAATWTEFKNNTGDNVSALPSDLGTITMVKVTVDKIVAKDKICFLMDYKLSEHKTKIGDQVSQNTIYANFRVGNSAGMYFGAKGQSGLPLSYNLKDMAVTGYVWNESDYNSKYDAVDSEKNTLYGGVKMQLLDGAGNEVAQTGNAANVTDANGKYTLIMPNDGKWNVKIVLPDGKKLVGQNKSGDVRLDSALDRKTDMVGIDFTPDVGKGNYTMTNLNAGIYDKPIIKITASDSSFKVGSTDNTLTATVTNRAPNTNPAAIDLKYGQPTNIASVKDNGNETATVSGLKTGVVKSISTIGDGYDGEVQTEYAVIVYSNVKYDANAGTGDVPKDDGRYYPSVNQNGTDINTDKVITASGVSLSKTGYTFTGWSTDPDATTADYQPGDVFKTGSVAKDTTLYAVWKPIKYTVTYHQNDIESVYKRALDGTPTSDTSMNGMIQNYTYDVAQKLVKNDFELEGYDFKGWNTAKDGSGKAYTDEQSIKNLTAADKGNINLYAQWDPHEYDITYDNNAAYNKDISGKDLVDENGKVLTGTGSEFTGSTAGTHHVWGTKGNIAENRHALSGYYFVSWNTKADGTGTTYVNNQQVKNLTAKDGEKITLYAQWAAITSASYTPIVTKALTGETPKNDQAFEFVITPDTKKAPMPEKDTVSITGAGEAAIGSMIFNREGVYKYTIKEKTGEDPNYSYDTNAVTMTVTVTENDQHQLVANVRYSKAGNEADKIRFTNAYKQPKADVAPVVTKTLLGDTPERTATFNFELSANSAGAPMPEGTENNVAKVTIDGSGTVKFSNMTFKDAGTYVYTIREKNGGEKYYVYDDKPVTMTVTVEEKDYKVLTKVLYIKEDVSKESRTAEFTNSYTLPIKSDPPVEKVVNGDKPVKAGEFTFLLSAEKAENPMPKNSSNGSKEVTINGAGSVEFGEIEFTEPGEYVYKVTEKNNGQPGYAYDETVYNLTYKVVMENGKLKVTRNITSSDGVSGKATFVNIYKAKNDPTNPKGPKTGDTNDIVLWTTLMSLSCVGLSTIGIFLRKKKKSKEPKC